MSNPIKIIRTEANYKSALLYHLAETHKQLSPFITDKRLRSKTIMVANTNCPSGRIINALSNKGFVLGDGYGKYKGRQIRIASFPTHSKEQIELLADTISALNF